MQVDVTRLVTLVKPPLLFERKTSHPPPGDHTFTESIGGVVEVTTATVGLASVSVRPEHDRVKINPSAAGSNEPDPHRAPVGLYSVTAALQHFKCG